jgi:hypothetical protein
MRTFLKKIFVFLLSLIILLFGVDWLSSELIIEKSDFKLISKPKYLVLGHSQPEHAFNDSLIEGLKNLAEGGESYFYTYYKSVEVIKKNPTIETVFINFSNNNIAKSRDFWTWDCYYMAERLKRFSHLIQIEGKLKLAYHNLPCFTETMLFVLQERLSDLLTQNFGYSINLGGYKISSKLSSNTEQLETSLSNRLRVLNSFDSKSKKTSKHNLKYLNKLIEFCKKHGKQVVLVRLPQQQEYNFWENEIEFSQIRKQYFTELPFLDFAKFPLEDEDFIDHSHLSYQGACRFSNYFGKLLKTKKYHLNQKSLDHKK